MSDTPSRNRFRLFTLKPIMDSSIIRRRHPKRFTSQLTAFLTRGLRTSLLQNIQ